MKLKIRGIFSTALTKLLSDNKFEIVAPSEKINERFDLDDVCQSADTLIYDKDDLNGVTIHGSDAKEVVDVLKKNLEDTVFWRMQTGSIFCGKIEKVDKDSKTIYINLGKDKLGTISLQNFWGILKTGEKVLVQIKGETKEHFLLSTKLRLFGNNLILIKGGFTKVSKHVRDKKERNRLMSLSDDAKSKGWGVLWKVLAESKSDKELKSEIDALIKDEERIKRSFDKAEDICLFKEGLSIYFVDFGNKSKGKLDEIRCTVCPTILGHHTLKAGGFSLLAETLDIMSDKLDEKKIRKAVKSGILSSIKPGQYFSITQKKVGGRDLRMRGIVQDVKKGVIEVRREMKYDGKYDGLDEPIEAGDFCITKIKENEMFIQHEYHDEKGKFKGKYFSVCTPVELFPESCRSIDLEVDVVEKKGKMGIIDEDKLESADGINVNLKKEAMKIASDIKKGELKW